MIRKTDKQNEKGALIVEVIAVIALLGVMGPLLFRQVMSRNEEVDNINIATEVRTLKEGFAAYIMSNRGEIIENYPDGECHTVSADRIINFLPGGNDAVDYYEYELCNFNGFLQGFVTPQPLALPEKLGLKRSARIANLIGADGAICQNGNINGVAGGWGFEDTLDLCHTEPMFLATTGMDTYVPEVAFEDYSASLVNMPNRVGFEALQASHYFSVGANCYKNNHNTATNGKQQNDEIVGAGGSVASGNCDPLFWVGKMGTADTSDTGTVYVKNDLMIGRKNSSARQAVGIFADESDSDTEGVYSETLSDGNKIEVYDNAGRARVIINGKGEIIARGEGSSDAADGETLTITNEKIQSSIKAANKAGELAEKDAYYKVDPAYTSVMKDIILDSRGGARLSEILPNYISKGFYSINETNNKVSKPTCPAGYAPAVIVTPIGWSEKAQLDVSTLAENLKITGNVASGNAEDLTVSDKGTDTKVAVDADLGGLTMEIDEKDTYYWVITFKDKTGKEDRTDVLANAQTFCVFDTGYGTDWSDGKKPSKLILTREN